MTKHCPPEDFLFKLQNIYIYIYISFLLFHLFNDEWIDAIIIIIIMHVLKEIVFSYRNDKFIIFLMKGVLLQWKIYNFYFFTKIFFL